MRRAAAATAGTGFFRNVPRTGNAGASLSSQIFRQTSSTEMPEKRRQIALHDCRASGYSWPREQSYQSSVISFQFGKGFAELKTEN
jgi:hypothetical protein